MKWPLPFIVILSCTINCFSQQDRALMDSLGRLLTRNSPQQEQTSIYLRSNKEVYVAGEDLWFNAFVLHSQVAELSGIDAILYLQLVQQQSDSVVWHEMYPVSKGIAAGHVYLPQTLPEGSYQLKAYTAHSFLSGQRSFFATAPIQVVKDPRAIKSYGQLASSIPMRKGMGIQLTIVPECDKLLAGVRNVVAFKALSAMEGLPVAIQGTLLKNGRPLLAIKASHAGMGHFTFTPEAGASYSIQVDNASDSVFKLPAVLQEGVVLQLEKNEKDSIYVKVLANRLPSQTVLLSVQVRGMLQAIATGKLKDSLLIKIPVAAIQQGIAVITVYNEQLQPLAERLAYIHLEKKLNIQFSEVKDTYVPKEQVIVKIKTSDTDGKPVPAVLSLRVYDQFFTNRKNVRDILNYYELSTQLNSNLYDPAWYFDSTGIDRKSGLDLLLQTEGLQKYNRSTAGIKAVLSDSVQGVVLPVNKQGKQNGPVSLMVFNYNKSNSQVAIADKSGTFYLTPNHLATGRRFFIKYFSDKDHIIRVTDPFDTIRKTEQAQHPATYTAEKNVVITDRNANESNPFQYGSMLEEVVVKGKGRGFGDRYLGILDSIARFEGNTDFVGQCGWLNCPACGSGKKPVEGVTYTELTDSRKNQVSSHPFSFGATDMRKVTYHYPTYTEEELLKKFKMIITKGFYQTREYYHPDYEKEDKRISDTRNSLYWSPLIVTDENGEATIRFYCSDVISRFIGIAEGISGDGDLGSGKFTFSVR